jgi:hemoglobin
MRTSMVLVVGFVFTLNAPAVRADDKPLDRAELDKRAAKVAYDAAATGSGLFNRGRHDECLRYYEGTLTALLPLLDHQPKLAAMVKEKLEKAKGLRAIDGAFVLREALDAVMGDMKPDGKKPDPVKAGKPLWDRLGGEKGVRAVTREFLTTAAKDPKVNVDRNGNYPLTKERAERVEQLLVEMISSATGGPLKYTGRDMKNAHAGMKITEDEFNAAAVHLIAALKKFEVPQAEIDELIAIVASTKKDIVEVPKK